LPVEVRYLPVGISGENLAISALAVRPADFTNELFASVTNYGVQTKQVLLSIYLNDILLRAQQIEIPGMASKGISITDFPLDSGIISARISTPAEQSEASSANLDVLIEDNVAFAINNENSNRRVLIITPGNFF
jgi:hypothetical protein